MNLDKKTLENTIRKHFEIISFLRTNSVNFTCYSDICYEEVLNIGENEYPIYIIDKTGEELKKTIKLCIIDELKGRLNALENLKPIQLKIDFEIEKCLPDSKKKGNEKAVDNIEKRIKRLEKRKKDNLKMARQIRSFIDNLD